MKKYPHVMMSSMIAILFIGCYPAAQKRIVEQPEIESVFYLPAEIISVDKDLVTIRVEKPVLFKGDVKLALQLAQGIIQNSYLLEGKETHLNQTRVKVMRVMGDDIQLKVLGKPVPYKPGEVVKISLEKKTIAIRDFEVIIGKNKEVAKYVQEDVTTALVNSGQFNVVERLKLKSVLDELTLSELGLTDSKSAKQIGKLLGADIILTGTLAATGEEWNVNLRLINTETGLITTAFNKRGSLHELKEASFRETRNIDGRFEDNASGLAGWIIGTQFDDKAGKGGYQKVYIDETQGANGTTKSLAMDFRLGSGKSRKLRKMRGGIRASIMNRLKRDLSHYSGIRFFIKANKDLTIRFLLADSQKNTVEEENWFHNILVTKDWQEVCIPFNSLSLQKVRGRRLRTNQILELNNIERIEWVVSERNVKRRTEGTIWLDEVTFY
ncbi:MAG: CIA30 family protein [Deltaproteobacteria bacterium]|nr:CIA30 family protein [Deltaproteobacteria bacterium]MBW2019607.1 CIA30 family protein [Deltaproteobacteria bacterium]MBW2074422.1 CIA30 family protein [Deltaproteobacteria bacterium]RLB82364.1 MAG: hypothetical protein DRH17_06025 [Deltaproteobacteria bacterium]